MGNLDWLDNNLDSGEHDLYTFEVARHYANFLKPWSATETRAVQVLSGKSEAAGREYSLDLLRRYDSGQSAEMGARRSIFAQATFVNEKVDWAFASGSMEAGLQAGLTQAAAEAPFLRLKPTDGDDPATD